MPAHIADARCPGCDFGALYFGRGRVERHGKCLAPVQDLDHPAVEGPNLNEPQNRVSEVGKLINPTPPGRQGTNVYSSVSRAGVDVPPSGRLGGAEVAAYEGLEHRVSSVRHDAAVQRMCQVLWSWILSISEVRTMAMAMRYAGKEQVKARVDTDSRNRGCHNDCRRRLRTLRSCAFCEGPISGEPDPSRWK